jgi:hypothetical protein
MVGLVPFMFLLLTAAGRRCFSFEHRHPAVVPALIEPPG